MRHILASALACALALGGCAYRGGDMGDPLNRKFHWFSFVEGEDIRNACAAGSPDRFRLIYNGIYDQQLRIYEYDAIRKLLIVKVSGDGNVAEVSGDDLLAPWRSTEGRMQLDEKSYAQLTGALASAGAFGPPAIGLDLPSRGYFWTSASCHQGRYTFTGWRWPSAAFDRADFAGLLFALDPTGIPVAQPQPIPFDPQWEDNRRRGEVTDFTMKVSRNGLLR